MAEVIIEPVDVCLGSEAAYNSALDDWAAETLSTPDRQWRGPGVYRYGGYYSDDNKPMATLERLV